MTAYATFPQHKPGQKSSTVEGFARVEVIGDHKVGPVELVRVRVVKGAQVPEGVERDVERRHLYLTWEERRYFRMYVSWLLEGKPMWRERPQPWRAA